jgi:predicted phosphodiesterase
MRIAAFSDVHGNTPALRAVLSEILELDPDVVVNLGDVASGGVDPRGTLDLLGTRPDFVTVRGNHERQVLGLAGSLGASDVLAAAVLTPADVDWLASLPPRVELAPGVLAFHGSPDDDLQYLLQTVTPEGLREATDDEVVARLGTVYGSYSLFLCGHTHLQRTRRLPDGSLVVNPGSVGWPAYTGDDPYPHSVETGSPLTRFTVLDGGDGAWQVDEWATMYDVEAAVDFAVANGRHDVAYALRTGRNP